MGLFNQIGFKRSCYQDKIQLEGLLFSLNKIDKEVLFPSKGASIKVHGHHNNFSHPLVPQAGHLKGHEASKASLGSSTQNQQAYVDMGKFYGTNVLTQCMDWQTTPASISQENLQNGFFGSYFAHLKQEGVNQLDLSFAQLSSITSLLNGSGQQASPNDKIATMFNPAYPVKDSSGQDLAPNFLSYMVSVAHQNGIKVDVSFGGAAGKDGDFKLPKLEIVQLESLTRTRAHF